MKNHLIALFVCANASAWAAASSITGPDELGMIHQKYTGQRDLACGGAKLRLPAHFPGTEQLAPEGAYLGALVQDCTNQSYSVFLGLTETCNGAHACTESTFSYSRVGEDVKSRLVAAFSSFTKPIELASGQTGFFAPPQCGAYCDEAKLFWTDATGIFVVGAKTGQADQATIDELVKAANSYLQPKD